MEKQMQSKLPGFDVLLHLAQHDPEALEQLRLEQVKNLIDNAPPQLQQRLRGLQFEIDAQREIHSSALGACIKISEMMHESFFRLRNLLNQFSEQPTSSSVYVEPPRKAKVLHFPSR